MRNEFVAAENRAQRQSQQQDQNKSYSLQILNLASFNRHFTAIRYFVQGGFCFSLRAGAWARPYDLFLAIAAEERAAATELQVFYQGFAALAAEVAGLAVDQRLNFEMTGLAVELKIGQKAFQT